MADSSNASPVGSPVFFLDIFLQRTCIDTDADRQTFVTRTGNHFTNLVFRADIAGIDAQAIGAVLCHRQGDAVIK
jgi:hypothetical protein